MIPDAVLYGKKTKQKLFGEVKSCQYVLKNGFFLALLFFVFGCPVQREGSLVPGPGIEPTPPAMELKCPRHWTAQEAPPLSFLSIKSKSSKLFAGVTLHFIYLFIYFLVVSMWNFCFFFFCGQHVEFFFFLVVPCILN